jgi:hypothetical protein
VCGGRAVQPGGKRYGSMPRRLCGKGRWSVVLAAAGAIWALLSGAALLYGCWLAYGQG